jgi:L-lactate dehydrogenase complex protein LldG
MLEQATLQFTFTERAQAAGAKVHTVAGDPTELKRLLTDICCDDTLVTTGFSFIPDTWAAVVHSLPNIHIQPDEKLLAAGYTGITDVFAGVAETGSIALSNAHDLSGPVSLFTSRHIALLDAHKLYARPRDLFTDESLAEIITNMVFITGPSATADMGKLVRGVHGPGRLDIVLIGGEV